MSFGQQGHVGTHRSRKQAAPKRSCLDSGLPLSCNVLAKKSSTAAHKPRTSTSQHSKQPVNTLGIDFRPLAVPSLAKIAAGLVKMPASAAPAPAAGPAAPHSILKTHRQRVQRPPKAGSCSFCHATESPMWRNGPEAYPKLCNACGMRYYRCIAKTPPEDPFDAKILASMARKAARAAAASMGASNDKQTVSGARQQHPAASKAARHPKQTSAAAAGPPSPVSSVRAQAVSGKRVRKATFKALALEEELIHQGRSKRSKVAWQAQLDDDDDDASIEDMIVDDNMSNQEKPSGEANKQHSIAAAGHRANPQGQHQLACHGSAGSHSHLSTGPSTAFDCPAYTIQHSLQEVVHGPKAVSTADGGKLSMPCQKCGLVLNIQQHDAGLQAASSLDSAATEDAPQV